MASTSEAVHAAIRLHRGRRRQHRAPNSGTIGDCELHVTDLAGARYVDFADHAAANPGSIFGACYLHDFAYEFVS